MSTIAWEKRPASEDLLRDADLVRAMQADDREAFRALVERYKGLVVAASFSFVGNFSESEEIAQEVFAAAWVQRHELRQPEQFRTWLFVITRNLSCRSRRTRKSRMT